jgi:hypothetical protein
LQDRIRTRRGRVPTDFSSAIALCEAAYASSVTTRGVPLFFIALRKKHETGGLLSDLVRPLAGGVLRGLDLLAALTAEDAHKAALST